MFYLFTQKKSKKIKKTGFLIAAITSFYFILLLTFSLTSHYKILPINQDKCFDDWCASIIKIEKNSLEDQALYLVTIKVSNHARGRAQKPDHPQIYVIDEMGNKYVESKTAKAAYEKQFGAQKSIESRIDAQSSYKTTLLFALPKYQKGYVVITEGGFPTPLIIGDEGSLLHKKSVTPLE